MDWNETISNFLCTKQASVFGIWLLTSSDFPVNISYNWWCCFLEDVVSNINTVSHDRLFVYLQTYVFGSLSYKLLQTWGGLKSLFYPDRLIGFVLPCYLSVNAVIISFWILVDIILTFFWRFQSEFIIVSLFCLIVSCPKQSRWGMKTKMSKMTKLL